MNSTTYTWDERAYDLLDALANFDTSSHGPSGRIDTINAVEALVKRAQALIEEFNNVEEDTDNE